MSSLHPAFEPPLAAACISFRMPWKLLLPGSCDKVIKHARDLGVLQLAKNMGWISCRMLLEQQDLCAFNSSDIAAQVIRKKLQIARENPDFWCWKVSRSELRMFGNRLHSWISGTAEQELSSCEPWLSLAELGVRAEGLGCWLWPLLRPSSEIIFCSWLEALSIVLVVSPLLVWGYSWLLGSLKATNASSLGYYPQQIMCIYILWYVMYDIWHMIYIDICYTVYDIRCMMLRNVVWLYIHTTEISPTYPRYSYWY